MNAATITRQSKSNLALAFVSLGRERKRDITIFYAFCRVVDDIADSAELSVIEKRVRLANWRQMLRAGAPDEPLLARDVRQLMEKYSLSADMFSAARTAICSHKPQQAKAAEEYENARPETQTAQRPDIGSLS